MSETFKNYRGQSRDIQWGTNGDGMSIEQINCGSMLRIADAVETLTKDYENLKNSRDIWRKSSEEREREVTLLTRRIAGLRGYITKLKTRRS